MGLTIHYDISFKGTKKQLIEKLTKIRSACMDLPFEEVGKVKSVKITRNHIKVFNWLQNITKYPNNFEENLVMRDLIMEMLGTNTGEMVHLGEWKHEDNRSWRDQKPTTLVSLSLWAGEGCEGSDVNFEKRNKKWICSSFCKTQYATEFVKCHLLVITLFDMFKAEGFDVEIDDEGNYWETRNLKVLAKNINDYTGLISGIAESMKNNFGKNVNVIAPIDNCKNYMDVE